MNIDEIEMEMAEEGLNPDDYIIVVTPKGYKRWLRQSAPEHLVEAEQLGRRETEKLKAVIDTMLNGGDA